MTDATPTVLLDGLVFPEGPRWHEGRLWFSDMHAHRVMTVDLEGNTEVVANVPNRPSGLGFLPDGRLLIVSMTDRRLLRLDGDDLREVANLYDLAPAACNDMVVDGKGRAYIGNFGFDFEHGEKPKATNLVMVDSADYSVRVVAQDLMFPNGAVVTPDGRTLIVAETFGRKLTAFTIGEDGSLSKPRLFADVAPASPDGICLDAEGAVWVASPPTGEFLRVWETKSITDRIPVPGKMAIACALGGEDRRTLFLLTAEGSQEDLIKGQTKGFIETVQVEFPGAGWP